MPTSASSSSLSSMTVSAPLSPRPPLAAQLVQRHHHPNLGPIKQAPLNTNTKNTMAVTWRHTSVQVWAESRAVPLHMVFAPTEGDACQEAALDPVSTTVAIAHMDMLDHHHHQPQVTLSTSNAPPVGPVAEKDMMLAAIVSTSPSRTPSATADWSQPLCARNVTRPGTHHVVPLPWGTQCVRVEYWPVMTNAGANHAVVNGQHQGGGHVQGLKCAQTMPVHVVLISFGPPPPPSSSAAAAMPAPASSPSSSSSLVRSHSNSKLALSSSSDSTVFLRPTTPASAFTSARRTHANMQLTRASPFSPRPPSPKAPNVLLSRDAYVHNRRGVPLPMIPPSMLGLATWMPPPPGAPRPALKLKMLTNHTTASTGDTDADDDTIGGAQDDESMGAAGQLVALNPDAPYWSRAGGGTWRPWSVSPHPSTVHSFETDAAEAGGGGAGTLFASEHEYMQAMAKAMAGADADAHETEAGGAAGSIGPSDEDLAMFQRYLMASQEPSELPAPPALASVLSRDVMSSSASLGASTASPRVRHLGINRAFPPPSSATPNGSPVELSMNATPPNPGTGAFASPPGADAAYPQFADEQQQQQHQQHQHQHQPRYAWMHPEHPPQYKYPPPAPTSAVSSPSMYNEFGGLTRRQAQQHRYRPYPSFAGPRSAGAREAQPMQH